MPIQGGLQMVKRPTQTQGWTFALNVNKQIKQGSIVSDYGTAQLAFSEHSFYDEKTIIGILETPEKLVYFWCSNDNTISEIGVFDDNTGIYEVLIRDTSNATNLRFNVARPIRGTFTFIQNELVITFWEGVDDGANYPRIINVDCLPFALNANKGFINATDVNLLKLTPDYNLSTIELNGVIAGGNLLTGMYYVSYTYGFNNVDFLPYRLISRPIALTGIDSNDLNLVEPSRRTDISGQSIDLNIPVIDTRFSFIKIAFIRVNSGVVSSYELPPIKNNGQTRFIISGTENLRAIPLEEIIVPKQTFTKLEAATVHNKQLVISNCELPIDVDLQSIANASTVTWVTKQVSVDSVKDSFMDSKTIFYDRHFKSGEIYALYLIVHFIDGITKAYHIPGRVSNSGDTDLVDHVLPDEGTKIPKYISSDTSTIGGQMGYWENMDEVYPSCFPSFAGQNVRHHKFPMLSTLINDGRKHLVESTNNLGVAVFSAIQLVGDTNSVRWSGGSTINALDYYYGFPRKVADPGDVEALVSNTIDGVNTGSFTTGNASGTPPSSWYTGYLAKTNQKIVLKYSILTTNCQSFRIYKNGFLIKFEGDDSLAPNNTSQSWEGNITLELQANDVITWEILSHLSGRFIDGWSMTLETYPIANTFGKVKANVLGLNIQQVNLNALPDSVKSKILGWEIGYAKRDFDNMTAIGQSALFPSKYEVAASNNLQTYINNTRFHSFDILQNKPILQNAYYHVNYAFNTGVADVKDFIENNHQGVTTFNYAGVLPIRSYKYIPNNVNVPVDNLKRESYLSADVGKTIQLHKFAKLLTDLKIFRRNVYLDFYNQEIVSTGVLRNVNETTIGSLFSGDTYTTRKSIRLSEPGGTGTANDVFTFAVESVINTALRKSGTQVWETFYPIGKSDKDKLTLTNLPTGAVSNDYDNYLGINTDFNHIFGKPISVYRCENDCKDNAQFVFANRIYKSLEQSSESKMLGWRTFLALDYFDTEFQKGAVNNLASMNNALLIQQKNSLFVAQTKDRFEAKEGTIFLGVGQIFDRKPDEVVDKKEGLIGGNFKFGYTLTEFGYVTVDRELGKVYLYNGQPNDISYSTVDNFLLGVFRNTLFSDIISQGQGLSINYDSEFKRLFLMFNSLTVSFTLSYSFPDKEWIGFHSFIPTFMARTRKNLYTSFYDSAKLGNTVAKHNVKTIIGTYYGEKRPSFIDVIYNENNTLTKKLNHIELLVEVLDKDTASSIPLKGATEIMAYNNNLCSGIVSLVTNNSKFIKKDRVLFNSQFVSKFHDVLIDNNNPFIDAFGNLLTTNIATQKSWYKKKAITGKFIILRVQFNNEDNNLSVLNDIQFYTEIQQR